MPNGSSRLWPGVGALLGVTIRLLLTNEDNTAHRQVTTSAVSSPVMTYELGAASLRNARAPSSALGADKTSEDRDRPVWSMLYPRH